MHVTYVLYRHYEQNDAVGWIGDKIQVSTEDGTGGSLFPAYTYADTVEWTVRWFPRDKTNHPVGIDHQSVTTQINGLVVDGLLFAER